MFRIMIKDDNERHIIKITGRIVGPRVEELRRAWELCKANWLPVTTTVDCSELVFMNSAGKELLAHMIRDGALLRLPRRQAIY